MFNILSKYRGLTESLEMCLRQQFVKEVGKERVCVLGGRQELQGGSSLQYLIAVQAKTF